MVVSPENRLIPLESDELLVAQGREAVDDLIGLEPGAVQQKKVAYRSFDFTQGLAVPMRVEDIGVLRRWWQFGKDFPVVPSILLAFLAAEGIEGHLLRKESQGGH